MDKRKKLFAVADSQQGYFTSQQAEEVGYFQPNFHRLIESEEWIREGRGLYRLANYSQQDHPELVHWTLWSCNREGLPQGVWSHETALEIHGLSDVMPSKMHMTVPTNFRRSVTIPVILLLHRANLADCDVQQGRGYRVTKPAKTIADVIEASRISYEQIFQAILEAERRGLCTRRDVEASCRGPGKFKLQEIFGIKFKERILDI